MKAVECDRGSDESESVRRKYDRPGGSRHRAGPAQLSNAAMFFTELSRLINIVLLSIPNFR